MTEINVLNSNFEASGTLSAKVELDPSKISVPAVHQVVKATLAGKRQGTASTKTRGEVRGGGAKPHKQKGTGRARQGSIRSPIMVGGGNCFGPKPRDYTQRTNKKITLKAIHSILTDKLQAGKLIVVEELKLSGKTKEAFALLNGKGLLPALVITTKNDSPALKAVRNIRNAKSIPVEGFSVYEAVKFENLVIEKEALEVLLGRLV